MSRWAIDRAALAILAASLALLLSAACADPDPRPAGGAEILASWDAAEADATAAHVLVRITCTGEIDAERFGLTVRVDSGKRRYWASIEEASALPAGASTTRAMAIAFAAADERLVPGSAAVEELWLD